MLAIAATGPALADEEKELAEPALEAEATAQTSENPHGSWVFVPVPVANPTVGNGLQLGRSICIRRAATVPLQRREAGSWRPTTATRLVAAFHDQSLRQDRFRLTGARASCAWMEYRQLPR
jgi:hypothetical protein